MYLFFSKMLGTIKKVYFGDKITEEKKVIVTFRACHTGYEAKNVRQWPECSATGMGQFPICKLKWYFLKTSVTACTIDENVFSAPVGIFYVRTEI